MKEICESLRQHAKNKTHFEKKKMLLLTKQELKSYQDAKVCCICAKRILKSSLKAYIIGKIDHCHLQVNIEVQHIVFVI